MEVTPVPPYHGSSVLVVLLRGWVRIELYFSATLYTPATDQPNTRPVSDYMVEHMLQYGGLGAL